jgi:DNA polymerase elongation subunit (family B)
MTYANKKFFGFDTETDEMGRPVILATNTEYTLVHNFTGCLEFIGQYKYKYSVFWTWNLTFDAEGLIKLMLEEFAPDNWREVTEQIETGGDKETGRKAGYSFLHPVLGLVNIYYIKAKFLSIRINKHTVSFYDIAQFYGHAKLETQASQFLKLHKEDVADWVDKVKEAQEGKINHKQLMNYLFFNCDDVGYYCMKDAELTLKLASVMQKAFEGLEITLPNGVKTNISFKNPMSQAKIAENFIKDNVEKGIPYPMIPKGVVTAFHNVVKDSAFHGGMFETVQRGYFDEPIYDYDINSAYPTTMSQFDHWANGEFKQVEEPTENKYGWYITSFDCKYIPYPDFGERYTISYRLPDYSEKELTDTVPNARILYPVGKRTQVITKPELDFMKKHNFKCKVHSGYEWFKTKNKYINPFSWIPITYQMRQDIIAQYTKADMRQYALKILMNSTYGKTAQARNGIGALTNFFYASYITSETRMKISEVAINHEDNVIDIATDGICLNCECPELELSKNKLGLWEPAEFKGALFVGSGIRQMFKQDGSFESHARGLTNDPNYDIKGEMEKHLKEDCLKSIKKRPLHLNECAAHTKLLKLEDVNCFKTVEKKLNVNTDKKHVWSKDYIDFEDFLTHKTRGKPFNVKDLNPQTNLQDFS